jgi:hypothetical protein
MLFSIRHAECEFTLPGVIGVLEIDFAEILSMISEINGRGYRFLTVIAFGPRVI